MGLYKRGNKWWMRWTDEHGQLRRKSSRSTSKDVAGTMLAAERLAVERRRAGLPGASPVAATRPIAEQVDGYLAQMEAEGLTRVHIGNHRSYLRRAREFCKWTCAQDITRASIERYLAEGLEGKARKTRLEHHIAIRQLCAYLMAMEPPALVFDPSDGAMPKLRGKAGRMERSAEVRRRPLSAAECALLLAAAPTSGPGVFRWEHRRRVYAFLIGHGLRRAELAGLRVRHVQLDTPMPFLTVPGELAKSGRPRVLPIRVNLLPMMREWLSGKGPDVAFALPLPDVETMHRDLRRAGVQFEDGSGRKTDLHALRATCCTLLGLSRVPTRVAQLFMGHESIQTTEKYYAMVGIDDLQALSSDAPDVPGVEAMVSVARADVFG